MEMAFLQKFLFEEKKKAAFVMKKKLYSHCDLAKYILTHKRYKVGIISPEVEHFCLRKKKKKKSKNILIQRVVLKDSGI